MTLAPGGVEDRSQRDEDLVALLTALADAWCHVDAAGCTRGWHGDTHPPFGASPRELEGRSLPSLFEASAAQLLQQVSEAGEPRAVGDRRWQRLSLQAVHAEGDFSPVEATLVRRREDLLLVVRNASLEEQRAIALVEASTNEIYLIDSDQMHFVEVNQTARTNLGYSALELRSMTPLDIRGESGRPPLGNVFAPLLRGETNRLRFETDHKRRDGSTYPIELTIRSVRIRGRLFFLAVGVDRTEQRELEAQLLHARKMEAIGRLAGGVAHDFNNALTAILGNAELARMDLEGQASGIESLDAVIEAGQRAAEVTRQLLTFARRQIIKPVVLDPAVRLRGVERLLQPVLGEDIRIEVHVESHGARIRMDPGQLEQLIMNLAVNARDAMPRGGKLTLECQVVDLDLEYAAAHEGVAAGRYLMLAVTDTGVGMDDDTMSRIFEPFFTTKEVGHGTGLGLASCHGIVKQSGGHIWVYSEPSQGTTFKVYLPLVAGEASLPVANEAARGLTGSEHVLVVEDDQRVRSLCAMALERLGYRVSVAATGQDALVAARSALVAVDLLLTDVVLPDMRGPEVAERVRGLFPKCIVLFTSGYTENSIVHDGVLDAGVEFLPKPYTPSQLARALRVLLDAREVKT
jgi:two-component system, cell cycle sensor histidine kinase and response regulator CckA